MLLFLGNIVDQIDLAFEHVQKADPNNARFGLMLTDNVVEITLHQMALDQRNKLNMMPHFREEYEHAKSLEKALGQRFKPKIQFVVLLNKLSPDIGHSILLLHSFRNEVYHIGVKHQTILPMLSLFYFDVACQFLSTYSPPGLGWGSHLKLPERAEKYFQGDGFFPGSIDQYQAACLTLADQINFNAADFVECLADRAWEEVEQQDESIDMVATGGPERISRERAVLECQSWPLAFSEAGRQFTKEQKWAGGSVGEYVAWIGDNYPGLVRNDPIPSWRNRAKRIERESDPHVALKMFCDFMNQTQDLRAVIEESHRQVEQYIDEQIDRMRGR